jgi:hypothetical protein
MHLVGEVTDGRPGYPGALQHLIQPVGNDPRITYGRQGPSGIPQFDFAARKYVLGQDWPQQL